MTIPEHQVFDEGSLDIRDGVVKITGEFSVGALATAFNLLQDELFSPDTVPPIIEFDMSETEYLDSTGLRYILSSERMNARLNRTKLRIRANESIDRLFEITGIKDLFEFVVEDVEQ